MSPSIRRAQALDIEAIARIYGLAIRSSVATFDLDDPPVDHWAAKVDDRSPGNHVLVAERAGELLGFAHSSPFRPRPAYAGTRETSVYVDSGSVGQGVGTTLYGELMARLRQDGIHLAVAVVAEPNPASVALHEHFGFRLVGTLHEVGRKFDRWVDTRWYELLLDP